MLKAVVNYSKIGVNYTVHVLCYYDRGNWVNCKCNWVFDNRIDMINEVVKYIPSVITLKSNKIIKELLFINKIEGDFSQFYYN